MLIGISRSKEVRQNCPKETYKIEHQITATLSLGHRFTNGEIERFTTCGPLLSQILHNRLSSCAPSRVQFQCIPRFWQGNNRFEVGGAKRFQLVETSYVCTLQSNWSSVVPIELRVSVIKDGLKEIARS